MLKQKIYEWITEYKLVENGDKLVLGVSGGPDSICMLDLLQQIKDEKLIDFEMVVAHVNHGLRQKAKKDEEFVVKFCDKIKIPCFVKYVNIKEMAKIQKRGLEETGRMVRYDFFDEIMKETNSNKISIAHNANDKAETIIMNILRGTGPKGLIGIEKMNGKYIRPLLETRRFEIEEYLKERNIVARYDESNDENVYTRNKIRNIVLPYIENEFNPNIIAALGRLSDIIKEEEDYLQKQTAQIYQDICICENPLNDAEITIDLKKFNQLEKVMQKRIILYAICKIFGTTQGIEKIHIEDIIQLCNRNIGNKYLTPNKHTKIVIQKKQLKIMAVTG